MSGSKFNQRLDLTFFSFQERLSYIGPEEFVQAFVQKDPLDNDKVMSAFFFSKNTSGDKVYTVVMQSFFWLKSCGQT